MRVILVISSFAQESQGREIFREIRLERCYLEGEAGINEQKCKKIRMQKNKEEEERNKHRIGITIRIETDLGIRNYRQFQNRRISLEAEQKISINTT